ncbi:MAG TPA: flavin reductase family protein [Candidatus Lachnoclostridium pullistercoris]|uniref:Flavin reductase family protein n=1 Tax=Candidatus Lachnoclostridium pullistercoris TaxID=2838632 RepID=A0A9D2P9M7_9FIRM|nr:flavin reductase family protein [Candidatus Lachnoclostridium pullistercoris]
MKKNIGNSLALYPTPLVVVGTMVDGKPNWLLVGHLGIIGHDHVMISLASAHYTNKGIKESKKLSINIVDEALLARADRSGCVSGSKEDKSKLFEYVVDDAGVPMIAQAPVTMVCSVEDIYETKGFESFICTIDGTYAEESVLNEEGKIDYRALKPVLFEMPTYEYLRTGDVIGKCMSFGRDLEK